MWWKQRSKGSINAFLLIATMLGEFLVCASCTPRFSNPIARYCPLSMTNTNSRNHMSSYKHWSNGAIAKRLEALTILRGGKSPLDTANDIHNEPESAVSESTKKWKIQLLLPNGRSRPITLSHNAFIAELLRVVKRMIQLSQQTPSPEKSLILNISSKIISMEELELQGSDTVSKLFSDLPLQVDSDTEIRISVEYNTSSAIEESSSTHGKFPQQKYPQEKYTSPSQTFHIKRQKSNKNQQVVISEGVMPIVQELFQHGGIALLGGQVISTSERDQEPTSRNRRRIGERKHLPQRKVFTVQDLQSSEENKVVEQISVMTAVHLRTKPISSWTPSLTLNSTAAASSDIQQQILEGIIEAKDMLLASGLQPIGIVVSEPLHLSASSTALNCGWNPMSCLTLMVVAELLQNNQSVLLSVSNAEKWRQQQEKSQESMTAKKFSQSSKRRRATAISVNNSELMLEAYKLSRQAWQLFANQSILLPSIFYKEASSSTISKQPTSANRMKVEPDEKWQTSLQLKYPVRVGNNFDVEMVDADYFAVPLAISLGSQQVKSPALATSQHTEPITSLLGHAFPTKAALERDPETRRIAQEFVQKILRKIVQGSRRTETNGAIDLQTWHRLHDVHFWQYLREHVFTAKVFSILLSDLRRNVRTRQLSSRVLLELELWMNSLETVKESDEDTDL